MGGNPSLGEEATCRGREAAIHHRREKAMHRGMNLTSHGCGEKKEQGIFALNMITWCQSLNRLKQIVICSLTCWHREDDGNIDSDSDDEEWTTTWLVIDYFLTSVRLWDLCRYTTDHHMTSHLPMWLHMTFLWALDDLTWLSFLLRVTSCMYVHTST